MLLTKVSSIVTKVNSIVTKVNRRFTSAFMLFSLITNFGGTVERGVDRVF